MENNWMTLMTVAAPVISLLIGHWLGGRRFKDEIKSRQDEITSSQQLSLRIGIYKESFSSILALITVFSESYVRKMGQFSKEFTKNLAKSSEILLVCDNDTAKIYSQFLEVANEAHLKMINIIGRKDDLDLESEAILEESKGLAKIFQTSDFVTDQEKAIAADRLNRKVDELMQKRVALCKSAVSCLNECKEVAIHFLPRLNELSVRVLVNSRKDIGFDADGFQDILVPDLNDMREYIRGTLDEVINEMDEKWQE